MRSSEGFTKRIYRSPGEFMKNLGGVLSRAGAVFGLLRGAELSATFRERLMLVVTGVNDCRYCSHVHARLALASGISREEIENLGRQMFDDSPEYEVPALLYAQHWAETEGRPDPDVRRQMEEQYGEQKLRAIELSMEMIRMGNLFGNTFDYGLYRLSSGK